VYAVEAEEVLLGLCDVEVVRLELELESELVVLAASLENVGRGFDVELGLELLVLVLANEDVVGTLLVEPEDVVDAEQDDGSVQMVTVALIVV